MTKKEETEKEGTETKKETERESGKLNSCGHNQWIKDMIHFTLLSVINY